MLVYVLHATSRPSAAYPSEASAYLERKEFLAPVFSNCSVRLASLITDMGNTILQAD